MIDLHIHTTASDGQHTPAEVVQMAAEIGLTQIAITDHDSVEGIAEGEEAARRAGIGFIPGIEISVKGGRELHLLGYGIDPQCPALLSMCEEFAENRRLRGPRIVEFLSGYGVRIELEQAQKYAQGGMLGRPHFASAMVEAGYVATVREAFDRYLGTPEFKRVERPKPTPREGIEAIKGAGGVAVLAHPAQIGLGDAELEALLVEYIGYGLGGIECYYSDHTPEQRGLYLAFAEKYGLRVTGGSDFHGEGIKPGIRLGVDGIQF